MMPRELLLVEVEHDDNWLPLTAAQLSEQFQAAYGNLQGLVIRVFDVTEAHP
jgi:hypothetical protein